MLASELDYDLPEALIAQHPPAERDGGRLLVVGHDLEHRQIGDLPALVPEGALVVLNDTRVMKARVHAVRPGTGAKIEFLFLNPHPSQPELWQVMARANRPLRQGDRAVVGEVEFEVLESAGHGTRWLRSSQPVERVLERWGHMPLPPYVRRPDQDSDAERYQTVFARHWGSAAAPTAGLHLSQPMLSALGARGIELGYVTLHVGTGTFRPVSAPTLAEHPMHRERYSLSEALLAQLEAARRRGSPVVAIGTTVVRALESAMALPGGPSVGEHETALLIAPGFQFRIVEALLTNFHAPRSTLLALVYAFAGVEPTRAAYRQAVALGYRFLSYGDAMWIPTRLT